MGGLTAPVDAPAPGTAILIVGSRFRAQTALPLSRGSERRLLALASRAERKRPGAACLESADVSDL